MEQKDFSKLTDQELLEEAKKMKSNAIINATLIGIMIGIVVYSILKNSIGFFTLIPVFFALKMLNKPNEHVALK